MLNILDTFFFFFSEKLKQKFIVNITSQRANCKGTKAATKSAGAGFQRSRVATATPGSRCNWLARGRVSVA